MQTETSVKVEQRSTPTSGDVSLLRFQGDITSTSKEAIAEAYRTVPAGAKKVVFDFTKVDYLNSSGIAILIHVLMEAHKAGQVIHSFGLSPHFQKVFAMVGMTKYTHLHPDEAAALAAFQ
jgi:anti-sigma B factor antagonist